ncbi:MAG: TM2 domain-containing protein [Alphaproteobacteria bacterium]|nr:MAG: TM2 domain-containing protein [Alphaproteobacteria bacterium]
MNTFIEEQDTSESEKGFVPALLLCLFLGGLGAHRFYVGKIGTGILMIVTLGGLGIWAMVDLVMIAVGSFKDAEGRDLKR